MKRTVLAAAFVLAFSGLSATAQFGVYAKLDFAHHTDTNSNSSQALYGGGIGLYDNFIHAGSLTIGGDLRGDFLSGDQFSYRSLLFGLPIGVKLPLLPVKPYVEPVVGVGGAKYTGTTAVDITTSYNSKLTYGVVGGLNLAILPHLDWRVIEVGYTRQRNGVLSNPNILVSTGLGFRF